MRTTTIPERMTRSRIAAAALVEERAVRRCYAGEPTRPVVLATVTMAARRLGLPLPPGGAEVLAILEASPKDAA